MNSQPSFQSLPFIHGRVLDLDPETGLDSHMTVWQNSYRMLGSGPATHYIYNLSGMAVLHTDPTGVGFPLPAGFFAVVPGDCDISGGRGIIITRREYEGLFQIGGPVEDQGRLKYIDGCTDTLLASPPRKGDPCLNLLYFPAGIDQTAHVHPSVRCGLVLSGRGQVVYHDAQGQEVEEDLISGKTWIIHTNGWHKFRTPYGVEMRVLAYHPDSDFGPDDEEHPMLNRTIVDGLPANAPENAAIRTGATVEGPFLTWDYNGKPHLGTLRRVNGKWQFDLLNKNDEPATEEVICEMVTTLGL